MSSTSEQGLFNYSIRYLIWSTCFELKLKMYIKNTLLENYNNFSEYIDANVEMNQNKYKHFKLQIHIWKP